LISLQKMGFTINETSIGESNSNMETLLKMMEPLNESYFDITLKEYGNF